MCLGSKLNTVTNSCVQLFSMAVLVGCRALLQAFRRQPAQLDGTRWSAAAVLRHKHYVSPCSRHYSSDARDELRVRYLDREDAGEWGQTGANARAVLQKQLSNTHSPSKGCVTSSKRDSNDASQRRGFSNTPKGRTSCVGREPSDIIIIFYFT